MSVREMRSWGNNYFGSLCRPGLVDFTSYPAPPPVYPEPTLVPLAFDPDSAVDLCGGKIHGGYLTMFDGRTFGWGTNDLAQVNGVAPGTPGSASSFDSPTQAVGLGGGNAKRRGSGDYTCYLLTKDGGLVTWGWSIDGQTMRPYPHGFGSTSYSVPPAYAEQQDSTPITVGFIDVEGVESSGYALNGDGKIYAGGKLCIQTAPGIAPINDYGYLRQIPGLDGDQTVDAANVVKLGRNGGTAWAQYFITADGHLLAYFANEYGSCGMGTMGTNHTGPFNLGTPYHVVGINNVGLLENVIAASGGSSTGMAVLADGSVVWWGGHLLGNSMGSPAAPRPYPSLLPDPPEKPIDCRCWYKGWSILSDQGNIWTLGDNSNGIYGDGTVGPGSYVVWTKAHVSDVTLWATDGSAVFAISGPFVPPTGLSGVLFASSQIG